MISIASPNPYSLSHVVGQGLIIVEDMSYDLQIREEIIEDEMYTFDGEQCEQDVAWY